MWGFVQYPVCLNLLQRKLDIKPLITHRFGFSADDVQKAFQAAAYANTNGAIKVMFNL
jgi:L-iditol 2-dehydrogenase